MSTTELKALAAAASKTIQERADMDEVAFRECEDNRRAFRNEAGPKVLALIADLESAQDERRALLATEQNLRERVEALGEFSKLAGRALDDAYRTLKTVESDEEQEALDELIERVQAISIQALALNGVTTARALLEKTT